MAKKIEIDNVNIAVVDVNSWYNSNSGGGYQVTLSLTISEDMLVDGAVQAWQLSTEFLNGAATVTSGWLSNFGASVNFDNNTGSFSTLDKKYQISLQAGDTINFSLEVNGTDFDLNDFSFSFYDVDGADNIKLGTDSAEDIVGSNKDDYIDSAAGNDTLSGKKGDDTYVFNVGDGQDVITEVSGNDTIQFGSDVTVKSLDFVESGDDLVVRYGQGDSVTLKDYLVSDAAQIENFRVQGVLYSISEIMTRASGTDEDDVIQSGATIDLISVGAGNDYVDGGIGNDTINGGNGNDTLRGWFDNDTIYGGAGNDTIFGDQGDDHLYGENDDDMFVQRGGVDYIDGGLGYDRVSYEYHNDLGFGVSVDLTKETEQVTKNNGVDTLAGIEEILGTDYDDLMLGNDSGVVFAGLGGADTLTGGAGADKIRGDAGDDTLFGLGGSDTLRGGLGNDVIYGGDGNDVLYGDAGDDVVYGDAGNDIYMAGAGNDIFDGGLGTDTINYSALSAGIVANFGAASDQVVKEDGSIDQVSNVFRVIGTDYNDHIRAARNTVVEGGDGDDILIGNTGQEYLKGGAGNDILNGGAYKDRLYGGSGDDIFVFERGGYQDTIMNDDTVSTNDRLEFAGDIDYDQLWFEQLGNDLRISVIGTNDHLDLQNWYTGNFTVDVIDVSRGYTLAASDVQNLVDAMAAFDAPAFGQTQLSDAGLDDDLAAVLSANWDPIL